MSNLAAILVLVVCPANTDHCIGEPLRVVSYQSMAQCEKERPQEIRYATDMGLDVFGNCNPFDAKLLKDRKPINMAAGFDLNAGTPVSAINDAMRLGFSK